MAGYKRFLRCAKCARNANEGFIGPPECDEQLLPAMDGTCDKYTTNMDDVKPPEPVATIAKATLEKALALLGPVATRSRFAGKGPILVAVAPGGGLELRATDGETDLRISRGTVNGAAKRVVVEHELFLADGVVPSTQDPLAVTVVDGQLDVGGAKVPSVEAKTLPGEFNVGESGTAIDVPTLAAGNLSYLVRAISRDETRPALRYVLLEIPNFTFVATDGHRLHVQYAKEPDGRPEASVLLTKGQLLLLYAELEQKQVATTSKGCLVTGTMDGFQVEMAFTTGVAQFPEWRTLLGGTTQMVMVRYEHLRRALREEGKLYGLGNPVTVRVLKEYVQDVLVGWTEDDVQLLYSDDQSPVVVGNGKDRAAVLIYATEVEVSEPATKEGEMKEKKEKKAKVEKAPAQTSAPVAPAVKHFEVGQQVETPTGTIKIVRDRVAFLVELPNGRKRWFSDAALVGLSTGQPVAAESEEAA